MEKEEFYKKLGRAIFEARKKKGLTQEDVASRLSLKRTSFVNIEAGRQQVYAHTIAELAVAIELNFYALPFAEIELEEKTINVDKLDEENHFAGKSDEALVKKLIAKRIELLKQLESKNEQILKLQSESFALAKQIKRINGAIEVFVDFCEVGDRPNLGRNLKEI